MEQISTVEVVLEPWQKRQLHDYFKISKYERYQLKMDQIQVVIINLGKGGCPASYKVIPGSILDNRFDIYLTDAQIASCNLQMKQKIDAAASRAIEITPEALAKGIIAFR